MATFLSVKSSNDDRSIISETPSQINIYETILKLLSEPKNNLAFNWALYETIRLMEQWIGRDEYVTETVKDFVTKAASYLSVYEWTHYYGGSTVVRLELFLRAMSSVLYIISQSVDMINKNVRDALYKSVSKFWAVHRNTKFINANILFTLREIRTCLRKIKDDQSAASAAFFIGENFINVAVNVVHKDYFAAFGAAFKALDFEYSPGQWYLKWKNKNENYFRLRRNYSENNSNLKELKKFYKKLLKSSNKEWDNVQRKNTVFRNFEYKMLKSGGMVAGCSLPDHIDTLLIGYLDLFQRLLMEFFPQVKKYIERTVPLCVQIANTHVKKQLTFKAVEVLYVIKEKTEVGEFKNEIESNFDKWINCTFTVTPSTPSTLPSRPLSVPSLFPPRISDDIFDFPELFSSDSKKEPLRLLDTPTSAYTSFSSLQTSPPSTPLEEKRKRRHRLSLREIPTKAVSDLQRLRDQRLLDARKRIVVDVEKLFDERVRLDNNIKDVEAKYKEAETKYKEIQLNYKDNKNSNNLPDYDDIISKLKELLEEKEEKEEIREKRENVIVNNTNVHNINVLVNIFQKKKNKKNKRKSQIAQKDQVEKVKEVENIEKEKEGSIKSIKLAIDSNQEPLETPALDLADKSENDVHSVSNQETVESPEPISDKNVNTPDEEHIDINMQNPSDVKPLEPNDKDVNFDPDLIKKDDEVLKGECESESVHSASSQGESVVESVDILNPTDVDKNVELKEDENENIEPSENVEVKKDENENIEPSKNVEVKKDENENIEPSENDEVKEDENKNVESIEEESDNVEVKEDENENVEVKEDENENVEVKEDENEIVEVKEDENEIVEVKEDENEIVEVKEDENEIVEVKEDENEIVEVKEDENEIVEPIEKESENVEPIEKESENFEPIEKESENVEPKKEESEPKEKENEKDMAIIEKTTIVSTTNVTTTNVNVTTITISNNNNNSRFFQWVEKIVQGVEYIVDKASKGHEAAENLHMIRHMKLNHGLFLDGNNIKPSDLAIFTEHGELKVIQCKEPIVYTNINNPENDDVCISFPIAALNYKGHPTEPFSKCVDIDELYGHLFAKKTLIGGQLFIENLDLANSKILHSYLTWAHDSINGSTDNNLPAFPKIKTSDGEELDEKSLHLLKIKNLDGEELNTHEKLIKWMTDLYQGKISKVISYDELVSISQLRRSTSIDELETFNEKQPGVGSFKEKLSLEDWGKKLI